MSEHQHSHTRSSGGPGRRTCNTCGAHVSRSFGRVFGDNHDEVYACLECATLRALQAGGGTREGGGRDSP